MRRSIEVVGGMILAGEAVFKKVMIMLPPPMWQKHFVDQSIVPLISSILFCLPIHWWCY